MWARSIKRLALNVSPHNRSLDSLIYEEYPAISCPLVKIVGPSRNFVIFGGDSEIHRVIQFQFRIQYRILVGITNREWIRPAVNRAISIWSGVNATGHISRADFSRVERDRVSSWIRGNDHYCRARCIVVFESGTQEENTRRNRAPISIDRHLRSLYSVSALLPKVTYLPKATPLSIFLKLWIIYPCSAVHA